MTKSPAFALDGPVLVTFRSAELATVTVSAQALLVSSFSGTLLVESTAQIPALRGFTNVVLVAGVTLKLTVKDEAVGMVTGPDAAHVRSLVTIEQLMVPVA